MAHNNKENAIAIWSSVKIDFFHTAHLLGNAQYNATPNTAMEPYAIKLCSRSGMPPGIGCVDA